MLYRIKDEMLKEILTFSVLSPALDGVGKVREHGKIRRKFLAGIFKVGIP